MKTLNVQESSSAPRLPEIPPEASGASAIRIALQTGVRFADLRC
jgi:hypothetical protein